MHFADFVLNPLISNYGSSKMKSHYKKGDANMIDFKNGAVFKLAKNNVFSNAGIVNPILVDGETVISEYQAIRDFVVFTTKRIIAVNVQGMTGKKKDMTSLPYSKIQAFSIETAGVLDLDAELDIFFSGMGKIRFEFKGSCDIQQIGKMISEMVLK